MSSGRCFQGIFGHQCELVANETGAHTLAHERRGNKCAQHWLILGKEFPESGRVGKGGFVPLNSFVLLIHLRMSLCSRLGCVGIIYPAPGCDSGRYGWSVARRLRLDLGLASF